MQHRHLTHSGYTLAAIDDIIDRGREEDWNALKQVVAVDRVVARKVLAVASVRAKEPYEQRHGFWRKYVEYKIAGIKMG